MISNGFIIILQYAAWRCKNLTTIKLGVRYCGDSLVGIARLKGQSLMRLEIPKGYIVNNSLNLRKLNKVIFIKAIKILYLIILIMCAGNKQCFRKTLEAFEECARNELPTAIAHKENSSS
jgi:hypothetical protein